MPTQTAEDKRRNAYYINRYGITLDEYNHMLTRYNGGCWICQWVPSDRNRRLSVDHKHVRGSDKRGKVRGLLCWRCNAGIAKFKDNVSHLRNAANYLENTEVLPPCSLASP